MGNASSIGEVREEQNRSSVDLREREYLMGESSTHTPPLVFTPQIPVAQLERVGDWMNNNKSTEEYRYLISKQGIPTLITWIHGGNKVFVEGSWDNWKSKNPLQRCGKEYAIMKVLPSGYYRYGFIVDGEWKYDPDLPVLHDDFGNIYNILDVQEQVPDNIGNVSIFDPPCSPERSYNNLPLNSDEFTKEPPAVPPQLHLTLLNLPTNYISCPSHVVVNHIFINKRGKGTQQVVAIGETCRFLAKHVTVVLYKSVQR